MDKRMYRSNSGNNCVNSRYRHMEPDHGDMCRERVMDDSCERERREQDFDRFPLAMCYVPWQCFRNLYENEHEALHNGTLFKDLDLKWYGRGCK